MFLITFGLVDTNLVAVAEAAAQAALRASEGAHLNTVVVAVIGLAGVVVTTVGTVLLAKINTNAKITKDVTVESAGKVDTVLKTTDQIHTLTNSNLSKVTAALEQAQSEVKGLKEVIAQMAEQIKETNVTLARVRGIKDSEEGENGIAETVKHAVVSSVKAPVKEAVQESFTTQQFQQIISALKRGPTPAK
jgi:hypothetical protein